MIGSCETGEEAHSVSEDVELQARYLLMFIIS